MKFDNFFLLIKLLKKTKTWFKEDLLCLVHKKIHDLIFFKTKDSLKHSRNLSSQTNPSLLVESISLHSMPALTTPTLQGLSYPCILIGMNCTLWSITITALPPFTQQVCLHQWHNLFEWRLCLMEFGYLTIY